MKTPLLSAALLFSFAYAFSQTTYVPDNNFEAFLEANSMGNGIANDDLVTTANISGVTTLIVDHQNISDFTGISGFTSLTNFTCSYNTMISLDLSANTALINLYCHDNYYLTGINLSQNVNLKIIDLGLAGSLTSLNVDNNTALESLGVTYAPMVSLNLTHNTELKFLTCRNSQLTALNLSQNLALLGVDVRNNSVTSLDLSNNTALGYIWCSGNLLQSLNVKNGANSIITNGNFLAMGNPSLTCITVDDVAYSTLTWFNIDAQTSFSENCALELEAIKQSKLNFFPNPVTDYMTLEIENDADYSIYNLNGQIIKRGTLVSGQNILTLDAVSQGIYLLNIQNQFGNFSKKLIKL